MSTDPNREMTPAYQQPMQYAPPPLVRPTSGTAVAGFVLSLLGLAPISIFLCVSAMKKTKTGEAGGHGLAVAGLILSIIGLLFWIPLLLIALLSVIGLTGTALNMRS